MKRATVLLFLLSINGLLSAQVQKDKGNWISTSLFPIEVAYERSLSQTDSLGIELEHPFLLNDWFYGSSVTRLILEYKRYIYGEESGFYLTINSGIGSELKYDTPESKWRTLSFIPWALTGVYVGGSAQVPNRYQVDYIPLNIGFGWKTYWDKVPLDLRLTVGYAFIFAYRDGLGNSFSSLASLPYKTVPYLTNQNWNAQFSPHIGFAF